jgi:hypothetical protein
MDQTKANTRRRRGSCGAPEVADPNIPIPFADFKEQMGWSDRTGARREAEGLTVIRRPGMRPQIVPARAYAWLRDEPIPRPVGRPRKGSK